MAAPVDPAGRVPTDTPCVQCGYNLRMLAADSRCPECGTAVGRSLRGDRLMYSSPDWVEKLARGIAVMVAMIAIQIVLSFGVPCLARTWQLFPLILGPSLFLLQIGSAWGAWLLTTPEPTRTGTAADWDVRRVVRVSAVAGLGCSILSFLDQVIPHAEAIGTLCGMLAGLVLGASILTYMRRLALRIPHPKHAQTARTLLIGYGVIFGLLLISGAIAAATHSGVAMIVAGTGGCSLAVLSLLTILFYDRFRRTMRDVAAEARQSWAAQLDESPAAAPPPPP